MQGAWAHVAVGQFKPSPCKGIGKLIWVFMEPLGNRSIDGVKPQREISSEHDRRMALCGVMRIRNQAMGISVSRYKLDRTSWALGLHPLITKQIVEIVVVPHNRVVRPSAF